MDGDGNKTDMTYDADGQELTMKVYNTGNTLITSSSNTYDLAGNLTETIDGDGNKTNITYDAAGQVLTMKVYNPGNTLVTSSSNTYDLAGMLTETIDGDGNYTLYTRDALDHVLSTATYNPGHTLITSSSNSYDLAGMLTETVDSVGNKTDLTYDAAYQPTSVTVGYGTSAEATTVTTYDLAGFVSSVTDPDGNTTTYTRNALGEILTTTDPLGNVSTNVYDLAGNLVSATNRNGLKRTMTYDADGHELTETWYAADGGAPVNQLSWTYDLAGNMLTASNTAGTYTMTYDGNRLATQTDPNGLTLTFGYDQNNNVTSVVQSRGTTILDTITSLYSGDNLLASRSFTDQSGQELSAALTYDGNENLFTVTRYDGAGTLVGSSQYTYDNNMVTHIHHQDSSSTQLADYIYVYDASERLSSETDNGTTITYSYDSTNQLVSAGTSSYSYDANGNRIMNGYQTGAGNQILSDGTYTYSYDKEGNVIKKSEGSYATTWKYQYDNLNRMVDAQEWSGDPDVYGTPSLEGEWQYTYDVFGNVIAIATTQGGSTTTTKYAYDQNNMAWADLSSDGTLQTRYVRGDQTNQLLARVDGSNNVGWYLQDHLNSVRGITNAAGTVVQSIDYDAFGNTTATGFGRYGYAGMQYEAGPGMYWTVNRVYDPSTGRWLSQDPLGLTPDVNTYRYVGNGPTNGTDPSGNLAQLVEQYSPIKWFGYKPIEWHDWNDMDALGTRIGGGLKTISGVMEIVSGVELTSAGVAGEIPTVGADTPVTIAGLLVILHGADTTQAGIVQMLTGQETQTYTSRTIEAGLGLFLEEESAHKWAERADTTISIVGSLGSSVYLRTGAKSLEVTLPRWLASMSAKCSPSSSLALAPATSRVISLPAVTGKDLAVPAVRIAAMMTGPQGEGGGGDVVDRKMSREEARENDLTERDREWPQRGLHETEGHHPLMQGKTYRKYWKERGFSDTEIDKFVVDMDKDIHRAISSAPPGKAPWWDQKLLGKIAEEEARQGGAPLTKGRVLEIAKDLLKKVDEWSPE